MFALSKAYGYGDDLPPSMGEAPAVVPIAAGPDPDGCTTLWKMIKVRLLSKSAHKGKVVRFRKEGGDEEFDSVSQVYEFVINGGVGPFRLELEHMAVAHDAFVALVVGRATTRFVSAPFSDAVKSRFARDLSYSSNAIEGNTCTTAEADAIIAAGAAETEAAAQILGHYRVAMALHQFARDPASLASINTSVLEEWHTGLNIAGLAPEKVGHVRREGSPEVIIRSSAHRFALSKDVPAKLESLFEWLQGVQLDLNNGIGVATEAHYRLVDIHPFPDGNGRVSRLFMNAVLLAAGFPMTSIMPGVEEVYYLALQAADQGKGLRLLERIVAEAAWRSLELDAALAP